MADIVHCAGNNEPISNRPAFVIDLTRELNLMREELPLLQHRKVFNRLPCQETEPHGDIYPHLDLLSFCAVAYDMHHWWHASAIVDPCSGLDNAHVTPCGHLAQGVNRL